MPCRRCEAERNTAGVLSECTMPRPAVIQLIAPGSSAWDEPRLVIRGFPHGSGTAKTSLVARHDRAEHDADARVGVGALGDGMVPGALAIAAHHEEITPP